jgi:hypothetical protein
MAKGSMARQKSGWEQTKAAGRRRSLGCVLGCGAARRGVWRLVLYCFWRRCRGLASGWLRSTGICGAQEEEKRQTCTATLERHWAPAAFVTALGCGWVEGARDVCGAPRRNKACLVDAIGCTTKNWQLYSVLPNIG